ncbi:hypothetical protein QA635_34105 [Bradyrhizobium brasilense]|uniref:hypothetical protein n=1 Tax=Bradyrhizobium brasilense TaxID=1419277 RepID=UPI0024B08245|nr:hypothetical protein [Bradyrhizobium australafricanum]WFU31515.1 hypothetical protein QA635_34105 [Bradyrhizobium australafricanum]
MKEVPAPHIQYDKKATGQEEQFEKAFDILFVRVLRRRSSNTNRFNSHRGALAYPRLDEALKRRLREIYRTPDPVALLAQTRDSQNELGKRVDQRAGKLTIAVAPVQSDLASFARELGDGWKQGEQRGIHRRRYVRRKPVPGRPSLLDPRRSGIEVCNKSILTIDRVQHTDIGAVHASGGRLRLPYGELQALAAL